MKYLSFLLFLLVYANIFAQSELMYAPVNVEKTSKGKQVKTSKYSKYGYPLNYKHRRTGFDNFSKQRKLLNAPKVFGSFSSRYDLRETPYLCEPRDQGMCGSCWAFGLLGALESQLLKIDQAKYKGIDLSENNMKECHSYLWSSCDGGIAVTGASYLVAGNGPVLEAEDIYIDAETSCKGDFMPLLNTLDFVMQYGYKDYIKQALLDYGALFTSLYFDDNFYNEKNNTYYYNGSEEENHAVVIVGWDDNKVTQGGIGAWIIRNSWGSKWGEGGYFYLSYNSKMSARDFAYFQRIKDYNKGFNVLQYDEVGFVTSVGYGDISHALIKFTATDTMTLEGIGTWMMSSLGNIKVEVYQSFNGTSLSGLLSTSERDIDAEGFYTINTDKIKFNKGESFYVKVRYYTEGYDYNIPVEIFESGYASPSIETGKCWVSEMGANGSWESVGADKSNKFDICIKAFGQTKDTSVINFISDKNNIDINDTVTFSNLSKGFDIYTWQLNGATPSQVINYGEPFKVVYKVAGKHNVDLKGISNSGKTDSITRENYINVIDDNVCYNPIKQEYNNSFEIGIDDLSDWNVMDGNDDGITWDILNTTGVPDLKEYVKTGNYSIYFYNDNPSSYADDYLISNCFFLKKDLWYNFSFSYRALDGATNENLIVALIDEDGNLVKIIEEIEGFANTNFVKKTIPLTVGLSGNYTILFYTYSDYYGICGMFIDDINISMNCRDIYVYAGNDTTICQGNTVVLNANGNGYITWNDTIVGASIIVTPDKTTNYIVKVEYEGCVKYDSVRVTVNPLPNISISSNPNNINKGETSLLTASGATSYVWDFTSNTNASQSVSPVVTTQYKVTGADKGCSSTASVYVYVMDSLCPMVINKNVQIVSPTTAILSWDNVNNADHYLLRYRIKGENIWRYINRDIAKNRVQIGCNICDDIHKLKPNTAYEWQMRTFCGKDASKWSDFTPIDTFRTSFVIARIMGAKSICKGDSLKLYTNPNSGITWSTGATTTSITVKPNATTTYTLTVSNNGASATAQTIVNVYDNLTIDLGSDRNICMGDTVILTANGAKNYSWNIGSLNNKIVVKPSSTTSYVVVGLNNSCKGFDTVVVNVSPKPYPNAGADVYICKGDTAELNATGGNDYLWSTGHTLPIIKVNPTETTTYFLTVSNNNCSETDAVVVVVNTVNANAGNDITICPGQVASLYASGGNAYLWSNGSRMQINNVRPSITTDYILTVTQNKCSAVDTVRVDVDNSLIANINNTNDTTICYGSRIALKGFPDDADYYRWSTGSLRSSIAIAPKQNTIYTLTITKNNCSANAYINVNVVNCKDLDEHYSKVEYLDTEYILYPNPISDGVANLLIIGNKGQRISLSVYNNIGEKIENEMISPNTDNYLHIINMSDYSGGMYFINIKDGLQNKTIKMILK